MIDLDNFICWCGWTGSLGWSLDQRLKVFLDILPQSRMDCQGLINTSESFCQCDPYSSRDSVTLSQEVTKTKVTDRLSRSRDPPSDTCQPPPDFKVHRDSCHFRFLGKAASQDSGAVPNPVQVSLTSLRNRFERASGQRSGARLRHRVRPDRNRVPFRLWCGC